MTTRPPPTSTTGTETPKNARTARLPVESPAVGIKNIGMFSGEVDERKQPGEYQ
jgi:hypothetical protein